MKQEIEENSDSDFEQDEIKDHQKNCDFYFNNKQKGSFDDKMGGMNAMPVLNLFQKDQSLLSPVISARLAPEMKPFQSEMVNHDMVHEVQEMHETSSNENNEHSLFSPSQMLPQQNQKLSVQDVIERFNLTKMIVCADEDTQILDKNFNKALLQDNIEWHERLKEGNLSFLFQEARNTNELDELLKDANLAAFFNA